MATIIGPKYTNDGTNKVKSRCAVSIDKSADKSSGKVTYTFTCKIQFWRSFGGDRTWGTLNSYIYYNGTQIKSDSDNTWGFSDKETWVTAQTLKFDKTFDLFKDVSFTIGYKTTSNYDRLATDQTTITIKQNPYTKSISQPTCTIQNNGNNTYTISGKNGKTEYTYYNNYVNSLNLRVTTDGKAAQVSNVPNPTYTFKIGSDQSYSKGPFAITKDTRVRARSYAIGTYNNTYSDEADKTIKFYSKPGTPSNIKIVDNGNNTFSITATKGSNGSNNNATDIEFQYSYDKKTWNNYSRAVSIASDKANKTVYARARTKGTYTGNNNAYYYSDYTDATSGTSVTYYTKTSTPEIKIDDSNPLLINIEITNIKGGTNNAVDALELEYPTNSGTKKVSISKSNINNNSYSFTVQLTSVIYTFYVKAQVKGVNAKFSSDIAYKTVANFKSPNIPKSISCTDNGDNTFSISAEQGATALGESRNEANGVSIQYAYGTTVNNDTYWIDYNKSVPVERDSTVCARAKTLGLYGVDSDYLNLALPATEVKYYQCPNTIQDGTVTVEYDTKKPTKKSNFMINWTGCFEPYNEMDYNQIYGYRIYVWVNDRSVNVIDIVKTDSGSAIYYKLTKDDNVDPIIVEGDTLKTECTYNNINLKKNDTIEFRVWACSKNGKDKNLWIAEQDRKSSDPILIENVATLYISDGTQWIESDEIYISDGTQWIEADGLYVSDGISWQESE